MARKPRIEVEGALYHVITRGNQRRRVFKSEEDFQTYLDILSRYKQRYGFSLYAYVLMGNHVHLLMESGSTPLSKVLQGINQSYTMYYNRSYHTVGHLFQGRYKAIMCDKDAYLLSLTKYIHLNPLRAKMVSSPDDYRWSSHKAYVRRSSEDTLVDTESVLRMFAEKEPSAWQLYRSFMGEEGCVSKDDIYGQTVDDRLLGDERFVEDVGHRRKVAVQVRNTRYVSIPEIAAEIEKLYGVTMEVLCSTDKSRKASLCRKLLSIAAHIYGHTGCDIAMIMRKDPAMVSRHLKDRHASVQALDDLMASLQRTHSGPKSIR